MPQDSSSVFEARQEIPIGVHLPPPFERLVTAEFLHRTDSGGWLYAVTLEEQYDEKA